MSETDGPAVLAARLPVEVAVAQRSVLGDAAGLCDQVAGRLAKFHASKRKPGITQIGTAIVAAAKECGDAIWKLREGIAVPPDPAPGVLALAARLAADGAALAANAKHFADSDLAWAMQRRADDLAEAARLLGHRPASILSTGQPGATDGGQDSTDDLSPADAAASRAAGSHAG